ncbi:TonB-dependent receptor plug domain-containing protein [Roseobacter sp. GAI101]|uniref:TonB-dependent receptor plug domain-containing protein n=1 Tax=Roseobacter sp. (strain GAI101) TaxID=391589 RepID=UPI0012EDEFD4|nr:TonB-dependent receptor plug domain-containing protein [Roseobacter sp. GAI101]
MLAQLMPLGGGIHRNSSHKVGASKKLSAHFCRIVFCAETQNTKMMTNSRFYNVLAFVLAFVPFSVTAFTGTIAQSRRARSVADLVLVDPSALQISPNISYRDVIRIRGFDFFTYRMTLDGLSLVLSKLRVLTEIGERVELHKGPDTFVNGVATGQTVGGSINNVPKRVDDQRIRYLTQTDGSNSDQRKTCSIATIGPPPQMERPLGSRGGGGGTAQPFNLCRVLILSGIDLTKEQKYEQT